MPAPTTSPSVPVKEVRAYCRRQWGEKWFECTEAEKIHRKLLARTAIRTGNIAKVATQARIQGKPRPRSEPSPRSKGSLVFAESIFVDEETMKYRVKRTGKKIPPPEYKDRIVSYEENRFVLYTGGDEDCLAEDENGLQDCVSEGGLPGQTLHGTGYEEGFTSTVGNRLFVMDEAWKKACESPGKDNEWALKTFKEVIVYTNGR